MLRKGGIGDGAMVLVHHAWGGGGGHLSGSNTNGRNTEREREREGLCLSPFFLGQ
jgi:hypothetical protein